MILSSEMYFDVSIILGRPFLSTCRALVDMEISHMKFILNDEQFSFNVGLMQQPKHMCVISIIDTVEDDAVNVALEGKLGVKVLETIISNSDNIKKYDKKVSALIARRFYTYIPKKLYLDMNNTGTPPARTSFKEPPVL